MRFLILINTVSILLTLSSCAKEETKACQELVIVSDWNTENFKSEYYIQFPEQYEGFGMAGFEGNLFSKFKADSSALFKYFYCGPLFCEDFGGSLESPQPDQLLIVNQQNQYFTLDQKQTFCYNNAEVGILYYNDVQRIQGRYFMKINQEFLEALSVEFDESNRDEVFAIIASIHKI